MTANEAWRYGKRDAGGDSAGGDGTTVAWATLQAMARTGELADDDRVYWPDRGRWVKAWEVPGLFDLQAQTATAPPAAAAARRRRILMVVIAIDVAVTLLVGIILFVVFATD